MSERAGRASGALLWYCVSLVVVLLDQLSKFAAERLLELHVPRPVVAPVFDLMLTYNEGAAFSLLGDAGGWQRWLFISLAVAISAALIVWLARLGRRDPLTSLALALVLGGAIGNLIDRVLRDGRVVDFLYFHYRSFHWPAFNLADSAICVGAVLLVVLTFRSPPREQACC